MCLEDESGKFSRPPFTWEPRNPPWTDDKGPQNEYSRAVKMWCTYNNDLADGLSTKEPKNL